MPVKSDFFPNKIMDLPLDEMLIDNNFPHYSLFRKGRLEGLVPVNKVRYEITYSPKGKPSNLLRGRTIRNFPLLDIFKAAIFYNSELHAVNSDKRFLLDIKDSSDLIFDPSRCIDLDEWEKKNLYTFDIVVPQNETDSLYSCMIRELNQYSGYYGRIERRKMKCLALVRTSDNDKIKTKGKAPEYMLYNSSPNKFINNLGIKELVRALDIKSNLKLPVVDKTGYTGNVDIEFKADFDDYAALRKSFQKYDLDLIETEMEIDVFVISRK